MSKFITKKSNNWSNFLTRPSKTSMFSFLSLTCICQNGPDSVKFCHLSWAPVMLFGLSNKLILYGDHYQTPCSMKFYRKSYDEKNIQTIQKTSWGWAVPSSVQAGASLDSITLQANSSLLTSYMPTELLFLVMRILF